MNSTNTTICPCISFLCAVKGNWRNAVFIECRKCPYGNPDPCPGFLLAPDFDGKPIVVPVSAMQRITDLEIDKNECVAVIGRKGFEALYALWLDWNTPSPDKCALRQIVHDPCRQEGGGSKCCFPVTQAANAY